MTNRLPLSRVLFGSCLVVGLASPFGCNCDDDLNEVECAFTVEPSGPSQVIDFGEVAVGSERARTLRITNTGTVALTAFEFTFSERNATHYRVSVPEDFSVDLNSDAAISVVFAPLAESTNLGSSFTVSHPAVSGVSCGAYNVVVDGDGFAPLVEEDGGVTDGGDGDGDAGDDAGPDGGDVDGGDGDGDGGSSVDAGVVTPPDAGVILDPDAEWRAKGALRAGRGGFAAVRLPDDSIVVVGGYGPGGEAIDTVERFDPASGVSTVVGTMRVPRVYPGAALLASGRVLIVGGTSSLTGGVLLTTVEVFDPAEPDAAASVTCVEGQGDCDLDDVTGGLGLVDVPRLEPVIVPSPTSERALVVFGRYDVDHDGLLAPEKGLIDLEGTPSEVPNPAPTARTGAAIARLPNGQAVVVGGRDQNGNLLDDALLLDGDTGDITDLGVTVTPRVFGGAVALSSGELLVVGGQGANGALLTQIERISDVLGTPEVSVLATPVLAGRLAPSVVGLEGDLVLVAGGASSWPDDVDDGVVPLASADVLVPLGATVLRLSPSNALATPRFAHAALASNDGTRVHFVGGTTVVPRRAGHAAIEHYDLVENAFGGAGLMGAGSAFEVALSVDGPGVLSLGGVDPHTGATSARSRFYDAESDLYVERSPLDAPRRDHTVTRLGDDVMFLVAGGRDANGQVLATASLYTPLIEGFDEPLPVSLVRARAEHTATLLDDGRVLLCGGKGALGEPLDTCEIFTPPTTLQNPATYATASFELALSRMSAGRFAHTATLLDTGEVLLVGGGDVEVDLVPADLFDPSEDRLVETGVPTLARRDHAAVFLGSGRVLLVGGEVGIGGLGPTTTSEVYERQNEIFVAAGELATARTSPAAFRLVDGRVLVVGGATFGAGAYPTIALSSAELYTPDAFGIGTFEFIDIPFDGPRGDVIGLDVFGRAVVVAGTRRDGVLATGAERRTPLFFVERLMNPDP